jgi:hypothetical protein
VISELLNISAIDEIDIYDELNFEILDLYLRE